MLKPVIDHVEPVEEGVDQCPQDAVVHIPAEERGQHGTDTAKGTTTATTAAAADLVSRLTSTSMTQACRARNGRHQATRKHRSWRRAGGRGIGQMAKSLLVETEARRSGRWSYSQVSGAGAERKSGLSPFSI